MKLCAIFVSLFMCGVISSSLATSVHLNDADKLRMKTLFESVIPYTDLKNAYYSLFGLSMFGTQLTDETSTCAFLKKSTNFDDVESAFYGTSTAKIMKSCSFLSPNTKTLEDKLATTDSAEELYYATLALKNVGKSIDAKKLKASIDKIVAKDARASIMAYILHTVAAVGIDKADVEKYKKEIIDILSQADDADKKFLFYEDGLVTTAFVVEGVFKVMAASNAAPSGVTPSVYYKLANFLLSRKHTYQIRAAAQVLAALKALSLNNFYVPVFVSLHGSVALSDSQQKNVVIKVSNVWGEALPTAVSIKASSAKNIETQAVFMTDTAFTQSKTDSGVYELPFMTNKVKPLRGFYHISLVASSTAKNLIFAESTSIEVKVITKVKLDSFIIAAFDRDQSDPNKPLTLEYPGTLLKPLTADSHQRLMMKFQVKEISSDSVIKVHQAFVRFVHEYGSEVIFVAQAESDRNYKFSVDLQTSGKQFDFKSGKYDMELIVGDALIENPFVWKLGKAELELPAGDSKKVEDHEVLGAKPVIKHLFRVPDKRAPDFIAYVFSLLCLLPIALLLVLWMVLGINFNGFNFSISAIIFHAGIGAVLLLYALYWFKLNMFETLRYLAVIAVPTFFFGNRLLRSLAASSKKSKID